jgi:hypothetical protein
MAAISQTRDFDEILGKDAELNVQGLIVWLKRRKKGLKQQ